MSEKLKAVENKHHYYYAEYPHYYSNKDYRYEEVLIDVTDKVDALEQENAKLRAAMQADDKRLQEAGERVNINFGCDTPEVMADEIIKLRAELEAERGRWIPVEERLPEKIRTRVVLRCTYINKTTMSKICHCDALYVGGKRKFIPYHGGRFLSNIIFISWMLPDPPEKG